MYEEHMPTSIHRQSALMNAGWFPSYACGVKIQQVKLQVLCRQRSFLSSPWFAFLASLAVRSFFIHQGAYCAQRSKPGQCHCMPSAECCQCFL